MAASAEARPARRGPAPIASFDHDGSDESSPESKLTTARLPEIREGGVDERLAPPEQRARSHSTPAAGALAAPPAPRIDISRASSSSHHDSRDSSPEMALFAGTAGEDRARLELGFREDGALDLRSSTEELAFLEPAPGEAPPPRPASAAPAPPVPPAPPAPPPERRHSRKDSQSSELALLAVSGRTSRLSSVGSQCSAQSALSRVSRLSVVSGTSRSPSPHRMLLETSFCGPKPIETDPEISAGALVEQILGIVKGDGPSAAVSPPAVVAPAIVDARDRREVRTEVTVESARSGPLTPSVTVVAPPAQPAPPADKNDKDDSNRAAHSEERHARPRIRREPSEPEVYKPRNKAKDVIRIKLRPNDSYEEEEEVAEAARKPDTLELAHAARPAQPAPPSPSPSRRRSPSPAAPVVSRKSSFCSLFKSRETIASPESPSEALRRKRSLTEGRSRSKSRDRSQTPTSATKIRGSVLSLFRTPRRSGTSPSPGSREGSPVVQSARPMPAAPATDPRRQDKLKYYENAKDGIIHIPLRTPPDERGAQLPRRSSGAEPTLAPEPREPRPASAPQPRAMPDMQVEAEPRPKPEPSTQAPPPRVKSETRPVASSRPAAVASSRPPTKPIHRTVLPDGSIIIPLHSPTEREREPEFPESSRGQEPVSAPAPKIEETRSITRTPEAPATITSSTRISEPADVEGSSRSCDIAVPTTEPLGSGPEANGGTDDSHRRRKERLVFTTHVGSREQVFSTQFSITKTPSVTSEISGSFPSFDGEAPPLRDTHIAERAPSPATPAPPALDSGAATPQDAPRDSSESEPSSEAAPSRVGNDVEKRVLVVQQESFEEELPYVPTTLPQERSVALPMVPVRERGGVRVSSTQRPRAAAPPARAPPPPPVPPPATADKLRIKLPRRPRPAPASAPAPTTPAPAAPAHRSRTRSGSDTSGGESRSKAEWIDFSEVPERRKPPKRIQTLPAAGAGIVFSYVEPEHCRCECHGHAHAPAHDHDDHTPLLATDPRSSIISTSSAEGGDSEPASQASAGAAAGGS